MISNLPNQMFEIVVSTIATEKASFRERTSRIQAVSEAACALEILMPGSEVSKAEQAGERILRQYGIAGGFEDNIAAASGSKLWYIVQEKSDVKKLFKFGSTKDSIRSVFPGLESNEVAGVMVWQLHEQGEDGKFDQLLLDIIRCAGADLFDEQLQLAGSLEDIWKFVAAMDGAILSWGGKRFTHGG